MSSTLHRGLDLSKPDEITPEEIAGFRAAYAGALNEPHTGLNFWLDNEPSILKRYRRYAEVMAPNYEEESRANIGFSPYVAIYALLGFDRGVRYCVRANQNRGFSKAQTLECIGISFFHIGPRGMETIAAALRDFEWVESDTPAEFPPGWVPDPEVLSSGIDFSTPKLSPEEGKLVEEWYERTLGEVPGYVRLLRKHHPDLLKAYRARFENTLRHLPPQYMATTLLAFNAWRGSREGVRENLLLARALGVPRWAAMKQLGYASLYGGVEAFSMIEEVAGDVLDSLPEDV